MCVITNKQQFKSFDTVVPRLPNLFDTSESGLPGDCSIGLKMIPWCFRCSRFQLISNAYLKN